MTRRTVILKVLALVVAAIVFWWLGEVALSFFPGCDMVLDDGTLIGCE